MVGPRVLTSNELAIDDDVRLEIRPGAHLATRSIERIRHVEIHLRVKDVVFDPLLFRGREDGHVVAGILPALGPFFGFLLIARDERRAKLPRARQRRDERDGAMAEECRGFRTLMETAKDLARIRVLHQIDNWCLTAG